MSTEERPNVWQIQIVNDPPLWPDDQAVDTYKLRDCLNYYGAKGWKRIDHNEKGDLFYVDYRSKEDAENAVKALNNFPVGDNKLQVTIRPRTPPIVYSNMATAGASTGATAGQGAS